MFILVGAAGIRGNVATKRAQTIFLKSWSATWAPTVPKPPRRTSGSSQRLMYSGSRLAKAVCLPSAYRAPSPGPLTSVRRFFQLDSGSELTRVRAELLNVEEELQECISDLKVALSKDDKKLVKFYMARELRLRDEKSKLREKELKLVGLGSKAADPTASLYALIESLRHTREAIDPAITRLSAAIQSLHHSGGRIVLPNGVEWPRMASRVLFVRSFYAPLYESVLGGLDVTKTRPETNSSYAVTQLPRLTQHLWEVIGHPALQSWRGMKLDVSCMRYLTKDEYRVLTAVEMGMKNHDVVPVELIVSIAKLRHGGVQKFLSTLLRFKLIYHDRTTYNGYRLTYGGYDILALKTLLARGHIAAVGMKIGVGKESDIYLAQTDSGEEVVLKLHRLGRVSFRNVKNKRDYLLHRKSASWLYMSRLAALREFAFMKALHMNGFPTPTPIDQNRHVVLMSKVDGFPMYHVKQGNMSDPERVFRVCMDLIVRLAKRGLIHCDFNEFNLMISETGVVTLIDFPQMVSTAHVNAKEYFERDVGCVVKFFAMKMRFDPPEDYIPDFDELVGDNLKRGGLDEAVRASGWDASQQEEERLLAAWERVRLARGEDGEDDSESDDEEDDEDSEDVEGDDVDRETRGRHVIDERDDGDEEESEGRASDVDDEALLDNGDEIATGAGGDPPRK